MDLLSSLKNEAIAISTLVYNYVIANEKETLVLLVILWMLLRIYNKRKIKLKKRKLRNRRLATGNGFYNTGIRQDSNLFGIIKFKIRLADYCTVKGIRYSYLINVKLFGLEFIRAKYTDQKGQVFKRKITFRS